MDRDRDETGRPRQGRPRDALGRPLHPGDPLAVEPVPEMTLLPEQSLALAQELLEQGRPFSAHEVLEAAWKAGPPGERDLWQGLAQLCVSHTHALRGNRAGADRLRGRAAGHLRGYAGTRPHRITVDELLAWCEGQDPTVAPPPLLGTEGP
jgi:hypothetical protein